MRRHIMVVAAILLAAIAIGAFAQSRAVRPEHRLPASTHADSSPDAGARAGS